MAPLLLQDGPLFHRVAPAASRLGSLQEVGIWEDQGQRSPPHRKECIDCREQGLTKDFE